MKAKVLVVEDDKDTRDIYEEVLTSAGFDVQTAVNGKEGLQKALKGGFGIILLDLMMPVMDGIQFLKQLKTQTPAEKNGPIMVLTNLSEGKAIQEALDNGAAAYFVKASLNPDQLVREIRSFLLDSEAK